MNANPYLHLCCLTAACAPSSPNLRAVPIQTAVAVNPTTGARLTVELSVVRSGSALQFEATLTYTEKGDGPRIYRAAHAITSTELGSLRANSFNPVATLFAKLDAGAWRFVLDPTLTDKFKSFADMCDWVSRFQKLLAQCEKELRKDEPPAPSGHYERFIALGYSPSIARYAAAYLDTWGVPVSRPSGDKAAEAPEVMKRLRDDGRKPFTAYGPGLGREYRSPVDLAGGGRFG